MNDLARLEQLIDARTPLLFADTPDPAPVESLLRRIATRSGRPLYRWTLATGLQRLDQALAPQRFNAKPSDVLGHILAVREPALFMLLDLARYLEDPLTVSQLREIGLRHAEVPHTLLMIGADIDLPDDLRSVATHFEPALPTPEELDAMLREEAEAWGRSNGRRVQASKSAVDALLRNLSGLRHSDARRLIRQAIANDGAISEADIQPLIRDKYRVLDQGGVLSFEAETVSLDQVAGLQRLKTWLQQRRGSFLAERPLPGLDAPKGMLLLGVQGAGKSLAAKSVAGAWSLPLLRLDFGALYNKYHGETERNLREALRTAATMAPCVLWMDEIEKGVGGNDDDGIGRRVLGTLLTWMAERRDRVFMVATANDISALPPELLRKGRFDEIFFVDLPSEDVRVKVFEIHLRKRLGAEIHFDLPALGLASEGFSGAEVEQVVVSGLYAAHARGTPMTTEDLLEAIRGTRPLSVTMAEQIAALRLWASSRTVPAD